MRTDRSIIVGVFGATTGFTVTQFDRGGAREAHHTDIPWRSSPNGIQWPAEWLVAELDRVVAGASRGDVLTLAMPGADLWIESPDDARRAVPANPIQHYRGVLEGGFLEAALAQMPADAIYRRTHGANVAAFQPYGQLLAYARRHPGRIERCSAVAPLSDWMTHHLTRERGHDPVMLQDQGLCADGRRVCAEILALEGLAGKIAPWRLFDDREAIEIDRGVLVIPVTHDSVPARTAGYSRCPWVVWTGTWVGTACRVDRIDPSPAAHAAGIAFEGWGESLSAITNVSMLGRTYRALVHRAGTAFDGAAALALRRMAEGDVDPIDLGDMPPDEGAAVEWLVGRYGDDPGGSLAGLVVSAAAACDSRIDGTARLLGLAPPEEVAVIGGWARNRAFIRALEGFFPRVLIPPQAGAATAVGLAAHAMVAVGDAATVGDALESLPALPE